MSAAKVQRNPTKASQQRLDEVLTALNTDVLILGVALAVAAVPEAAFAGLFSNKWLLGAVLLSLLLQVAVIYVPFLQQAFFNHEPDLWGLALLRGCGELGVVAA